MTTIRDTIQAVGFKQRSINRVLILIYFLDIPIIFLIIYALNGNTILFNYDVAVLGSITLLKYSIFLYAFQLCFVKYIFQTATILDWFMNLGDMYDEFFICPHCLKSIRVGDIKNLTCPFCEDTNRSYLDIFGCCLNCKSLIRDFFCPFCNEVINTDAEYNENELEAKRYE